MDLFKSPVFIICCVLFFVHQVLQIIFNYHIPVVDSFLDSLLAMPIILTLLLFERRHIFRWKEYYRLTISEVIITTLFIAFVSEIIFPALSDDFTGDWKDLIFLLTGAIVFYFTINPKKQKQAE